MVYDVEVLEYDEEFDENTPLKYNIRTSEITPITPHIH